MLVLHVAVLLAGAWLAFAGRMSVGTLVAFNAVLLSLSAAVATLTSSAHTFLGAAAGLRRIREILAQQPVADAADALDLYATRVAALPEEFPVAFTFFLGAGVYRLARRHGVFAPWPGMDGATVPVEVVVTNRAGLVTRRVPLPCVSHSLSRARYWSAVTRPPGILQRTMKM